MRRIKRTVWTYVLPTLLLLAVTLPHLEQGDFRGETAHYGAIGVQAWRTPIFFWALHEHPAVPYFNKPPLVFWIHGFFLHVFGITLAAARIPSIFAAIGCILFTVGIARVWFGRATALAAGVILALSYEYFRRTREISLDLWQLFFMMMAVWFWVRASRVKCQRLVWVAASALGLALLCKPLTAFLIPCIVMIWAWIESQDRGFKVRAMIRLLGTTLLVALPWHLAMVHLYGDSFVHQYFGQEVAARLQGLRNREPVWYYAAEIGKTYWPWMIFVVLGLASWRRNPVSRHHEKSLMSAFVWVAVWALAITLFPDKRPRYALPLYPMLAMISAYGLVSLPWRPLRRWYREGLPMTACLVIVAGGAACLLPLRVQAPPDPDLSALVKWVGQQKPDTVYSAAMTSTDESMVYLKTGYWPNPPRFHPHPTTGSLMIYTDTLHPEPGGTEKEVFQQGAYRVMRK